MKEILYKDTIAKWRYINIRSYSMSLFWCALYKILLEYVYVNLVSPRWSYAGFTCRTPDLEMQIISWIILLFVALISYQLETIKRLSSTILQCLITITFIPGLVFCTYKDQQIYLLYCLYWVFIIFFYLVIAAQKTKPVQFSVSEKTLYYFAILFFVFCFYIWARYAHFRIQIDLLDIYGLREEAANYGMSTLAKYAYGTVQVCIPFLSVWALDNKNIKMFVVLCSAQLLAFFSQGSKTSFFALVVAIIVHVFIGDRKKKNSINTIKNAKYRTSIIIKGMCIAQAITILEYYVLKTSFLVDYLCRRMLFLPNLLNIYYHDFFSKNEFDYFRSSVVRLFGFTSPYANTKIPYIIGETYFNAPNMYTNNGLFSDAYMNLGIAGIVVLPFFIVLLLKLFDKCMGDANLALQIGAAVYIVICMIGTSFFTNLFSHGFLIMALLFCFLKKDDAITITMNSK